MLASSFHFLHFNPIKFLHGEGEKNKMRERCKNNDVVITIYVESTLSRHQKPRHRHQAKPKRPWKQPTSKSGYNRKAQLLAYTQQLRQSNPQEKPKVRRRWRVKCKVIAYCTTTMFNVLSYFHRARPFGSSS